MHSSRRSFLQRVGWGAAGLLAGTPLLEADPARARSARPPRRLVILFTPNGTILDEFFAPTSDGSVQLGRILHPLEPFREHLLLADGLTMGVTAIAPGNEHQRGMATWLTGQPNATGDFCGGDACMSGRSGWATAAKLLGARDKLDPNAEWTVVTLDEPRFGLLTLSGVLSSRARPDDSSPVQRGLLIRDAMLCQPIPDPPPGVAALPPPARPGATFRERFEAHTTDPTCANCHRLMDPLGFPFEIYDGIGRLRKNHAEIATEGTLSSVDQPADFQDIPGLVHALLATPELARCWATHWVTRLLGREAARNEALIAQISDRFSDGAALGDIIIEIVGAPELRLQQSN